MSRLRYRHRSITSRQLDTLCTIVTSLLIWGSVSQGLSKQTSKIQKERQNFVDRRVQHASLRSAFRWSYKLCSSICQFGYVE